jgi:hypothetical protein
VFTMKTNDLSWVVDFPSGGLSNSGSETILLPGRGELLSALSSRMRPERFQFSTGWTPSTDGTELWTFGPGWFLDPLAWKWRLYRPNFNRA